MNKLYPCLTFRQFSIDLTNEMRRIVKPIVLLVALLFSVALAQAQVPPSYCAEPSSYTYETIADGNWTSSSTWKNGNIPNASNDITNAVLIKHQVILSSSMNGNKDVKIKDTYFTIIYETLANIKFDNFKINYNDKK
ncbi:MAG: hypothetical protein KDC60_08335 [Bacteroidetes bacterium]|nr:hypothetical protein [Bacteroidota bacterium]MCB0514422.1 hypothetical protein [Bacteroidota bacterium]MCB9075900.1 hypothetical protein [Chitinophagales bacterium]HMV03824.1 hypothetical protein [Chitinophagales bacterium]